MSNKRSNLTYEDRLSMYICGILRHKPSRIGITVDRNGYVNVQELIDGINKKGKFSITFDLLQKIVESDEKDRYKFKDNMTKIRANQGHSIDVDLELEPVEPPDKLYHGTAEKNMESIMEKGLNKGKRHHVHLSTNLETAIQVGDRRKDTTIILEVDSKSMHEDEYEFFVSDNGVWLTNFVPPKYIKIKK